MSTQIDESLVQKISSLAKITLSPEEIKSFTSDFQNIFKFIDELQEVDVDDIKSSSNLYDYKGEVLQEDEVDEAFYTAIEKLKDKNERIKNNFITTSQILD